MFHIDDLTTSNLLIALGMTMIAGLATGLGSLMAFFTKKTDTRFLSISLGLSAGVMVYVSFMEMMPQALESLGSFYTPRKAEVLMIISFFIGIGVIALIDNLVPSAENPHEMHHVEELCDPTKEVCGKKKKSLKHTGYMVGLAIAIHNFPEGIASFVSALDSLDVAIPIIVAIAIHNIPEGIATSVPIYYATGNRKKALILSTLTGLSEPLGAVAAMLVLLPLWTPQLSSYLLAGVAGIMVYISIDELLPSAEQYGHHHLSIIGFIAGMAVMAISLLWL